MSTESLIVLLYLLSGLGVGIVLAYYWFWQFLFYNLRIADSSPPLPLTLLFMFSLFIYPIIFPILGAVLGRSLGEQLSGEPWAILIPFILAVVALFVILWRSRFPGIRPNIIIRIALVFFNILCVLTTLPWLPFLFLLDKRATPLAVIRLHFEEQEKFHPPRYKVLATKNEVVKLPKQYKGKLVYTHESSLFVLDLANGNQTVYESSLPKEGGDVWHPSGKVIVNIGYMALNGHLYLLDTQRNAIEPLISEASHPTWSPDARYVGFISSYSKWSGIYIIEISSRKIVYHLGYYSEPSWSPDGRNLTFTSHDGLYIVDVSLLTSTGFRPVRILDRIRIGHPVWSPDGKRIAFTSDHRNIFVLNLDGGQLLQLTDFPKKQHPFPSSLAWSPDGKRIAFIAHEKKVEESLYVIGSDGGNVVRLTTGPANAQFSPHWSVDGDYIAFAPLETKTWEGKIVRQKIYGLYLIRPDGRELHQLLENCTKLLAWDAP